MLMHFLPAEVMKTKLPKCDAAEERTSPALEPVEEPE